jgi:hypothetical protein
MSCNALSNIQIPAPRVFANVYILISMACGCQLKWWITWLGGQEKYGQDRKKYSETMFDTDKSAYGRPNPFFH